MQDQKTELVAKLQEYEKNKSDGDGDVASRVKELEAENAKLKESSAGASDQAASQAALAEMEEKYTS